MKTQYGWPLSALAFTGALVKKGDLVKYDGPVLSHYTSRGQVPRKNYLFFWVDYDDTHNRWLVFETSIVHLYDYLTNARSLADIISEDYNSKVIVLSTDAEGVCSDALLVPREELRADYLPEADSYYELPMPVQYAEDFARVRSEIEFSDRLQLLRAAAVRFRLVPHENRFASTVGSNDIGGFLQKLTRSFKSYVEARFVTSFLALYNNHVEQGIRELSRVLNVIEPRAVFSQQGSFEIDLAVDVLTLLEVKSEIVEWQRVVLQEYKRDVFDSGFATTGERPAALADATDDQMRAIFAPIVSIANNQNYFVQTRSERQTQYQTLPRVPKTISRQFAPARPQVEVDDVAVRTALVNILVEVEEGKDINTISFRELKRAMISVSTGDQTTVSGFTSADGQVIEFTEPIEVSLSRVGDLHQASYEPLAISTLGVRASEALHGFHNELRNLYVRLLRNEEDRRQGGGLRSEREGRILDAFADLFR